MLYQIKLFFSIVFFFVSNTFFLQEDPVKWDVNQNKNDNVIEFTAVIDSSWHLYAVYLPNPNEGPLPTEFHFSENDNFNFIGNVIESKPNTVFDENFGIQVSYFENNAHFKQKIEVLDESLLQIKIAYMVCNEQMCIPFEKTYELTLEI
jgi:hypothetical protein